MPMRVRLSAVRSSHWRLLAIPAIAILAVAGIMSGFQARATTRPQHAAATVWIKPNKVNNLDCNGWGHLGTPLFHNAGDRCTDPVKRLANGSAQRFIDNGWYVGHDEPSVKFLSNAPKSGNTMTYFMQVPRDPKAKPNASGTITDYSELSIAPWFGLPLCDPRSYPQAACKPDSDRNIGLNRANAAGSAFMELQFYPPGFGSFADSVSCSKTKWCAALTIDSLECNFNFQTCNPNCEEPVNFAFLQNNGVPAGPPSPQLSDASSEFPNGHTLMINQGDALKVAISDPPSGFTTTVWDLTRHTKGWMTASAKNGFMDTNIDTCAGTPFSFHAEYATAKANNRVPWAALEGGVLMQEEIGHFETCGSVSNQETVTQGPPGNPFFVDKNVFQTCNGGEEGRGHHGGSCKQSTSGAVTCAGAEAQGRHGPVACPTTNPQSGTLCEFSDGACFKAGTHTQLVNGKPQQFSWSVTGCLDNQFQNGDLDFDGTPYHASAWPHATKNTPTMLRVLGPFTAAGRPYPQVQFETDVGASSRLCNTRTGANCTAAPLGAAFYPFYTLSHPSTGLRGQGRACIWNFGTSIRGFTRKTFGGDRQYGHPDLSWFGGTLISRAAANPALACV